MDLLGNTLLWAQLWVRYYPAEHYPADMEAIPWSKMHPTIRARLEPFFAEYTAAEDKEAVLERYGL